MNILLTNVYSRRNGGDAGIVAAQLEQLRTVAPEADIVIASMEAEEIPFEEVSVLRSFFYYAIYENSSLLGRILNSVIVITTTTLWSLVYRFMHRDYIWLLPKRLQALAREYLSADKVITAGGGYLVGGHGLRSVMSIALHLHAISMALILKKPVLLHAQSFGPFPSVIERLLVRLVLNRSITIFIREQISLEVLKAVGITKAKLTLVPDAAFMLRKPTQTAVEVMREKLVQVGIDFRKPIIGLTVANRFPTAQQQKYERAFIEFIYEIAKLDLAILLIPQVTDSLHNDDDRLVQARIMNGVEELADVYSLDSQFSYTELLCLYSLCTITVGTRMHSVIFSFMVGTPAIAVSYEHKTQGIMAELGLLNCVLDGNTLNSEDLIKLLLVIQREAGKDVKILNQITERQNVGVAKSNELVKDFINL